MRLTWAASLLLALLRLSDSLLLGAFNIKSFGDTKASNATLMNIISTVCASFFCFVFFNLTWQNGNRQMILHEKVQKYSINCVQFFQMGLLKVPSVPQKNPTNISII